MMLWLAMRFGKRMEWNGPIVFGVGYAWCGKIWFEKKKEQTEIDKIMRKMQRSDFQQGLIDRWDTLKDFFKFVGGRR